MLTEFKVVEVDSICIFKLFSHLTNNHNHNHLASFISNCLITKLVSNNSVSKCNNLLIRRTNLWLVISVLFFVHNNLFQALISYFFIVAEHVLQLLVKVLLFLVPAHLLRLKNLFYFVNLEVWMSLVSFKMLVLRCKYWLWAHQSAWTFLPFCKIPL